MSLPTNDTDRYIWLREHPHVATTYHQLEALKRMKAGVNRAINREIDRDSPVDQAARVIIGVQTVADEMVLEYQQSLDELVRLAEHSDAAEDGKVAAY